jgi:protein TonB
MKSVLLIIVASFFIASLKAQTLGDSTVLSETVFTSVERAPKFPAGIKGFYQFIADNLQEPESNSYRFSNRYVIVDIVIDQTGKVVYGKITKGLNEQYNNAVLKLISKMPLWEPGLQNGKPVKCYQTIPIVFIRND